MARIKSMSFSIFAFLIFSFLLNVLITHVLIENDLKIWLELHTISWYFAGLTVGLLGVSLFFYKLFGVFVHELKHAFLTWCFGGTVEEFSVGKSTGYVKFKLTRQKLKFVPFIILAPYCFPFFTLIAFVVYVFLRINHYAIAVALMGFCFSLDLVMGVRDFYPEQDDITRILGSTAFCFSFILSIHYLVFISTLMFLIYGVESFNLLVVSLVTWSRFLVEIVRVHLF